VKIRLMIEELGPTYVKMGQIVSSQASSLPQDYAVELEKLQSNVPPFPSEQVRLSVIEELGAPPEELFARFDPEPFAAASTAQVHRALLEDGAEVAVKIQRPNIRRQMRADIGIMQNAARVFTARSEAVRSMDLAGMLEQFGNGALEELDYRGEAYNARRLAENMAIIEGVHIPRVYGELSTARILTMEFVRGVKITNVEALDAAGVNREQVGRAALRALVKQLPIDGFFHADPHPGNILVNLETGVLTFIDLGMVGEIDFHQRLQLAQLMIAVSRGDVDGMAHVLRDLSIPYAGRVDEKAYHRDFQRRVGRYVSAGGPPSFGEAATEGFDLLREHGLRLDPNLTLAVKALVQTEVIAKTLYPGGGLGSQGLPILEELAFKTFTKERVADEIQKQLLTTARDVVKRIPTLSEATLKWMDQYQKGRFEVTVDTSQLAKEVNKVSRLGREIVLALLLLGMIVGSALASNLIETGTSDSLVWNLLFRLTFVGYVLAMAIAFVVVIRLTWRWLKGRPPEDD
jgi:ubiquinone biosynthesis protein